MEMIANGYSLWLMPKGEHYNKLADLIRKLAVEYSAPIFEPHVTLVGEVPQTSEDKVIELTQNLVIGQKPFPVTLNQIDYQDFHFRALFVKAEVTDPLQSLHNRAKQIFGIDIPPYMPHLSLLYGNYPNEVKEKIIAEIGREQRVEFEVDRVHLVKGGKVNDWRVVKEFPFK